MESKFIPVAVNYEKLVKTLKCEDAKALLNFCKTSKQKPWRTKPKNT